MQRVRKRKEVVWGKFRRKFNASKTYNDEEELVGDESVGRGREREIN